MKIPQLLRTALFGLGALITFAGSLRAGSIYVDYDVSKGGNDKWFIYKSQGREIEPCGWGYNWAPAKSWQKMTWVDGSNFSKDWTSSWNFPGGDTSHVKAWPNVAQLSGLPKKCDSKMKTKATWKVTRNSASSDAAYEQMVETFGHKNSGDKAAGKPPHWEIMIRINTTQDKSSWPAVTVDGTTWYRNLRKSTNSDGSERWYCVYSRKSKTNSTTVNVRPFIVDAGFDGEYLTELAVGWEPYRGSGDFKCTSMSMTP